MFENNLFKVVTVDVSKDNIQERRLKWNSDELDYVRMDEATRKKQNPTKEMHHFHKQFQDDSPMGQGLLNDAIPFRTFNNVLRLNLLYGASNCMPLRQINRPESTLSKFPFKLKVLKWYHF